QPLTGITAEKHDSFISPTPEGKITMEFSGKELIKGEPDASSFPSGGIRATFEARGYTAWDCTSPAFLREDAAGVTLCIPTAFCSYTGEALDLKTPLLRSMEALSTQAVRIVKLFGHNDVKRVTPSVGPEQEYFLVDKAKYLKRDDLIFTGRTLFGAMPPKGQELDDHYFGSIKERVASFMKELNIELWKMGVTAKTQHNEVAPAQHELAPIYASANIATDHNQLVMECMKKVANRHSLACLLHEKPFAGVNGSGKHDNWSMVTDTGKNLLEPGKTPHDNIQFLLVLAAMLKAVDIHADLLRVSAANPGNDHRLGANEAPPAIISVFLGSQLEDVISQLIETGEAKSSKDGGKMNVGVHSIPEFKKDATDRNRTSPFAFTGNKFEFRMVASSMSIGTANTVLNTIVADVFKEMADELEKAEDFTLAVHDLIKKTLTEHQRIVFNGNGYAEAWVEEAARRGLPNIKSMVEAIPALVTDKSIKLFEKHKVCSAVELHSRAEILYEAYAKAINIEAKTMISMATLKYIPSVITYTKKLADTINTVKSAVADADTSVQSGLLREVSTLLTKAQAAVKKLQEVTAEANEISEIPEQSMFFKEAVVPAMTELRTPIDTLELLVEKELWPVPTYGDLLFEV
ncbi:MAG: glutamine synthetase catalytic region, partial [Herbinix sp.]|nr:glutamine synthetase catalytic region [Herbinix sp.]